MVIPCYNEEEILPIISVKLKAKLSLLIEQGLIHEASKVYFIDDGSIDDTWLTISSLVEEGGPFVGVRLTRNFGHQYALYAGLMQADGDALISLDADLQDDIDVIEEMIQLYLEGNEIVYGVRENRESDSLFKKWTAISHYRISALLGVNTVQDHADYRLLSRRAVKMLGQYRETNIYLRGVIPLLGLKSSKVYYTRHARVAGESKYNLKSMFSLSVKGVTSFSIMPLRIITLLGFLVFIISLIMGGWALTAAIGGDTAIAGWASTVIPIYLFGGIQLLALGVAGEYIGKTYIEVKNRPLYLIDEICRNDIQVEQKSDN
ncbi:glycosyltransferase family 2 protein [Oceanicoccus sp. KOV_DT_Chl]|uniref:glycosyltransferase family 2 protein n=1 Tax=Oceanicoccus sp. KOV_DT_Chl TaxID=1904639 RepID=UPI001F36AD88|nr:glycosyltransferase family 2 protein [Oceanicoccus sp. KOV_DT_Chl]